MTTSGTLRFLLNLDVYDGKTNYRSSSVALASVVTIELADGRRREVTYFPITTAKTTLIITHTVFVETDECPICLSDLISVMC
jgi:hypothetical protein